MLVSVKHECPLAPKLGPWLSLVVFAFLSLTIVIAARPLSAQTISGVIAGTVRNFQSKGMAAVNILVRNSVTGRSYRTSTDAAGDYRFREIPPGEYEVIAEKSDLGSIKHTKVLVFVNRVTIEEFLFGIGIDVHVRDEKGKPLGAVSISVKNPATGRSYNASTGADGSYFFPEIPPGAYEVIAEMGGFQGTKHTQVNVSFNQVTTEEFTLRAVGPGEPPERIPIPPQIVRCEVAEGSEKTATPTPANSVAVLGQVKDATGILGVTINQKEAKIRPVDSQTIEFWLDDVSVRPGRNDIRIVATNTLHIESSLDTSYIYKLSEKTVAATSNAAAKIPDRWALVVGISKYAAAAGEIGNLKYARRDAEAFQQFLRTPQGGGFSEDHILLLTDERATSANLRSGLRDFLGRAGENDLVIIFFAGHGAPDPARPSVLYFLTYDSDLERLGGTALDMDEVKLALSKIVSARRVVVLIDACHSAGVGTLLTPRSTLNQIGIVNQYLQELGKSLAGALVFAASQSNEPSWEGERWGGGHGVFTYFLLEGLGGAADRDADHVVTVQEMIDFVTDKVKLATEYKQHPTASTSTIWDPNLPLAMIPRQ